MRSDEAFDASRERLGAASELAADLRARTAVAAAGAAEAQSGARDASGAEGAANAEAEGTDTGMVNAFAMLARRETNARRTPARRAPAAAASREAPQSPLSPAASPQPQQQPHGTPPEAPFSPTVATRGGRFNAAARCHVAQRFLPTAARTVVDSRACRGYIGRFSHDGSTFVAGFQDSQIRLYDVDADWRVKKDISARSVQWTVTDVDLSPDGRALAYASINPTVRLASLADSTARVSEANITDVHENLDMLSMQQMEEGMNLGVWSCRFSSDGATLLTGTSQRSCMLYDMGAMRVRQWIYAHADDVNSVCFADEGSHIFYSASDDGTAKVWDTRTPGAQRGASLRGDPVGVLVGHAEGLTHIDSRGDGRYACTNSKDQTLKLWDTRRMGDAEEHATRCRARRWPPAGVPRFRGWDYRWMRYPGTNLRFNHPSDCSVATFRGHGVLQTLIRCYFSPAATTGQRYIYTGSHCGDVHIYDILSGRCVDKCADLHRHPVRAVSWHPTMPVLASVGWDGLVCRWGARGAGGGARRPTDSTPC